MTIPARRATKKEVNGEVREPPAQGILPSGLELDAKDQTNSAENRRILIADMNNTEIFELCEESSKQQYLDCNAYWGKSVIYWSCGRNMKYSQSPTEFDQNNRRHLNPSSIRTAVAGPNTDFLNDKECASMTESPWRNISTQQQELREFKIRRLDSHFKQRTQQPLNQRPDFA